MEPRLVGGKGGEGVCSQIISRMPQHDLYAEVFLGAGAVLAQKRPARSQIGIDLDPRRIEAWRARADQQFQGAELTLICCDAIEWLRAWKPQAGALVYCDPPYVMSARARPRRYYEHEMSDGDHVRLLTVLLRLPCMVVLSGYASDLYSSMLGAWRCESFWTTNRGGRRVQEFLWMNYSATDDLHDGRWVGSSYRERERLRRRHRNVVRKLVGLPAFSWREVVLDVERRRSALLADSGDGAGGIALIGAGGRSTRVA